MNIEIICTTPITLISKPVTNIKDTIESEQISHEFYSGDTALYDERFNEISIKDESAHYPLTKALLKKCFAIVENENVLHHKRIDLSVSDISEVNLFIEDANKKIAFINQPTRKVFDIYYSCKIKEFE